MDFATAHHIVKTARYNKRSEQVASWTKLKKRTLKLSDVKGKDSPTYVKPGTTAEGHQLRV